MATVEGLMHGLYLLWWVHEKQMSPALVAAVLAAGDLALMALEVPTGWFADRFGCRRSLIVGSLVQVIGMLWCWLGQGVPGLLVASLFIALGDAFRSGADQALLYRTCATLERADDFQRIEARSSAISLAALVVLILVGGLIVQHGGFAAGWLAETLLCAAGLGIAWAMVEPPSGADDSGTPAAPNLPAPVPYRQLAMVIAPAALVGAAASASSFLAQTTGATDPATLTLLVAAITAAEAGGSALASRLPPATVRRQVALMLGGLPLFAGALATDHAAPVIAIALSFLIGVAQPLRAAAIQRLAGDGIRARAASAASACDMAVSTLVLPLAGVWRGKRRV